MRPCNKVNLELKHAKKLSWVAKEAEGSETTEEDLRQPPTMYSTTIIVASYQHPRDKVASGGSHPLTFHNHVR